ncbi:MAG: DUF488 domain-containing protein [Chlorobiales bacterium]|nr:DUF488 domain-containing protein [Chlorobiales bacterium]
MFYRRKIILALLQAFEGQLPKTSLQKLLFLFTKKQVKPDYDFVPYLYGCYSFSANADLTAMVNHGILTEEKNSFTKADKTNYITALNDKDKKILFDIRKTYDKSTANSLMRLIYLNYHYYAIKSLKASEILTEEEYERVLHARPTSTKTVLHTIGYEGISLEEYLNRLIKNDVKVLVDVRSNPLSMKFGFSKNQLKNFCSNLNIEYVHIPEVGIESNKRQELNTQADYDKLFDTYRRVNLQKTAAYQEKIFELLIQKKRIALTCFESNINHCHRKHLADAITKLPEWSYDLKHI